MLSVRKSILMAMAATVAQGSFAASGNTDFLRRSLIGPQTLSKMSEQDIAKMDETRDTFLNQDLEELTWASNENTYRGTFKLYGSRRSIHKENKNPCREYTHTLMDKTTAAVVFEPARLDANGQILKNRYAMNVRGFVCLENNVWTRYTGDKSLLIPVSAIAQQTPQQQQQQQQQQQYKPTANDPSAPKAQADNQPPPQLPAPELPPTGPVGPDYAEYRNVIGRTKLGSLVHSFQVMRAHLDQTLAQPYYASRSKEFKAKSELDWTTRRINFWIDHMNRATMYIAIDQVALVIKEVKSEASKFAIVEKLIEHGRIETRLGDISSITAQFNSGTRASRNMQKKIRRLIKSAN